MKMITSLIIAAVIVVAGSSFLTAIIQIAKALRVVVLTNDVDIVQSTHKTIAYGKGMPSGNTYYKWPSWLPHLGVQVTRLPINVFSINLPNYAAYDKGRVPFVIDIIGFFRIADPTMAAERLASFDDLKTQLTGILQGAIRSILASNEIEEILEGRSKFGDMFTHAVDDQLKQWGTQTVKTIELMDIRDASDSKVIANIMMKKKSLIESQSRIEVALNMQNARTKEIEADRQVHLQEQQALEQVGERKAQQEKQVGIANQIAAQEIKAAERETALRQQAVNQVNAVRTAEIDKEVTIVTATRNKEQAIILSEAEKQQVTIRAEGFLAQEQLHATATLAAGTAKAEAERLILMAPVSTQIDLAKEIGTNEGYQHYLISIKQVEANRDVGIEQAKALQAANVKVIANAGSPGEGISSVRELFTSKGGAAVATAIEAFANTPTGAALVGKVINGSAHEDHK